MLRPPQEGATLSFLRNEEAVDSLQMAVPVSRSLTPVCSGWISVTAVGGLVACSFYWNREHLCP